MIDEQAEQAAQEAYRLLKPYLHEMDVNFVEITPTSLEASYQHKRSGLNYSSHVLESAIRLWEAWRELEPCRGWCGPPVNKRGEAAPGWGWRWTRPDAPQDSSLPLVDRRPVTSRMLHAPARTVMRCSCISSWAASCAMCRKQRGKYTLECILDDVYPS
jgi:hypothetical protein